MFRDLELLETLQQNIKSIEQHELCSTSNDGGESVDDFAFDSLFDIKCFAQKDDPELQRFECSCLDLPTVKV